MYLPQWKEWKRYLSFTTIKNINLDGLQGMNLAGQGDNDLISLTLHR